MVAAEVRRPGSHNAYVRHPAGVPRPSGEWRIYRWWGDLPPEAGWRAHLLDWLLGRRLRLLYLGETGRLPVVRALEHAYDKWWISDVRLLEVDRRVWRSEDEVLAYEAEAIRRERPVHNVAHNGNTPGRVRTRRYLPRAVLATRIRAAAWVALWLAGATSGWWWGVDSGLPAGSVLMAGVFTGTVAVGVAWLLSVPAATRRSGRSRNRGRRR